MLSSVQGVMTLHHVFSNLTLYATIVTEYSYPICVFKNISPMVHVNIFTVAYRVEKFTIPITNTNVVMLSASSVKNYCLSATSVTFNLYLVRSQQKDSYTFSMTSNAWLTSFRNMFPTCVLLTEYVKIVWTNRYLKLIAYVDDRR